MTTRALRAALLAAALLARPAAAEEPRPPEEELFGGPERSPTPSPPVEPSAPAREDALKVGGQLYLRATAIASEDQAPGDWRLASPNLLDVYLDARPNDRVRAFALGRVFYDPTFVPAIPTGALPTGGALAGAGLVQPGGATTANPAGVLDQLWIKFDVAHRAFVTAGRQHAKWGVGRFWNPTDYLHPVKRDPLAVFDQRTGTTMVKLDVPWERRGWNFYAVTVLEDVAGEVPRRADGTADSSRAGRIGVGGRAELVVGGVELGADALVQGRHRPRFGLDVSTGLWDLDVYGEAALRTTLDTPRWRAIPGTDPALPIWERYERHDPVGFTPQITAGATYAVKYSDEDSVSLGAEYFFDDGGYDGPRIYPVLLAAAATASTPTFDGAFAGTTAPIRNPFAGQANPFTPFYLGRHYGAVFASLPRPGSWNDTTFTLTVLGNLSDQSFVARLDHSVLVLTYLRVETYVAGHFGNPHGEFRLGLDLPSLGIRFPPQVLDAGVALRVSL